MWQQDSSSKALHNIQEQATQLLSRAKNFLLIPSVLAGRLKADPAVLILLASRRFPARLTLPILKSLAAVAKLNPQQSWFPALYEAAAGKTGALSARAEAALGAEHTEAQARLVCRLADTCLSVGLGDHAKMLLDQLNNSTGYARKSKARYVAWRGQLSEAISLLDPAHPSENYQRKLLESEYRILTDFAPTLAPVTDYRPEPGRILHVLTNSLPYSRSGYAYRTHAIMRAQKELGMHPEAVTRLGYPALVGQFFAPAVDEIDGIRYHRQIPWQLALGWEQKLQQSAELLAAQVAELKPALLHTTTHYVNAIVVKAVAEAFNIPWVYEVRGQLADTWASSRGPAAYDSERYRLFTQREARLAASADAVITLGEQMRQNLINAGVAADNIVLCPNAVDHSYAATPVATETARARLGLPVESQLVGTVSSIVGYEGLDDLLRAGAELMKTHPKVQLLIAGDGAALEGLKELATELGISQRVIFTGRVAKAEAPLYQAALDVFVVPRKDTVVTRSVTPLKSVEASALGKAVVASDLPALREVVSEGHIGLLVPPENPQELAAAIQALLDDADTREQLGAAGRRWVLATRTWEANARRYEELYNRLGALRRCESL